MPKAKVSYPLLNEVEMLVPVLVLLLQRGHVVRLQKQMSLNVKTEREGEAARDVPL